MAKFQYSPAARARQSQTGEPTEDTTYIVHYGEWVNHSSGASSFYGRERCFVTEEEACRYAFEKLGALAQLNAEAEDIEKTKINDMLGSIWVERKTITSQTIGFITPSLSVSTPFSFSGIRP